MCIAETSSNYFLHEVVELGNFPQTQKKSTVDAKPIF